MKRIFSLIILIIFMTVLSIGCGSEEDEEQQILYTVTFMTHDGNELSSHEVEQGESLQPPEMPNIKGKKFLGWSEDTSCITQDLVVTPKYEEIQNQLYFDYKSISGNKLEVTLSICGDVLVCGFEGIVSYSATGLTLLDVRAGDNNELAKINFADQGYGIKMFFFHDQIEDITEEIDLLIFTFDCSNDIISIDFDLDVTVFVDKDFNPVLFETANNTYAE